MIFDIKAAQEAAQQTAQIILPPTAPALPEETAWSMIYAEGGVLALLLAIGLTTLWKVVKGVLEESKQQNRDLMASQVAAISRLNDAVGKVEGAIRISDNNNQNAIARLSEAVQTSIARLDRHESKIDSHHDSILVHSSRLAYLESKRTPAAGHPAAAPRT